jgi:hypothetical protein
VGRSVSSKRVVLFALLLTLGGAISLGWGLRQPLFSDADAADALFSQWCGNDGRPIAKIGDAYFALFTSHYTLIDCGRGLIAAGLTIIALVWILSRTATTQWWLRTPSKRWVFFAIGFCILLAWWLGVEQSYVVDSLRQTLPICADSVGIPMLGLLIVFPGFVVICLGIGFLVSRQFKPLPVSLFQWDATRPLVSWSISLIFGGLALLILLDGAVSIFSSTWPIVVPAILALYLVECARSALLGGDV